MDDTDLDFSFNIEGLDRNALLEEAARGLDALGGELGDTDTVLPETPEGILARELMGDVIEFTHDPTVYKITDKDFLTCNLQVPVRFTQLTLTHNFYWVYFPIALFPKRGWGFKRLEVAVQFDADQPDPHMQPRAYQILPEKNFQTLLEAGGQLEVRLNENFEFAAQLQTPELNIGPAGGKLGAAMDVGVGGKLGTVIGPFVYKMKRAKIDHTPVGLKKVFWRIDGKEFFQDDDTSLIVITQVPKEAKEVKVAAAMQAYRYFSYADAGFQLSVSQLPDRLRTFFTRGLPVRKQISWDITPWL